MGGLVVVSILNGPRWMAFWPPEGGDLGRRDGGNATRQIFLKNAFLSCEVWTCSRLDRAARRMFRHDIDRVSGFGLGAGEQDIERDSAFFDTGCMSGL